MALSLYDLRHEIESLYARAVDPDTGEIVDEALWASMDACEIERKERLLYLAERIKSQEAEAAAYKAEAKKLLDRAASAEKGAERDRRYVDDNLEDGEVLKDTHSEIKRVKTPARVEIEKPEDVPEGFRRWKWEPSKEAIKAELKSGHVLGWAKLVSGQKLRIR